ncbi:hypothetical protein [Hankyongella ginsenosidimutans]|uniref:hypothetical protein n=1 Tax=Hankyongella ginsenosidimutans TaxID=1763828 RepID=UPI003CCC4A9C
MGTDTLNGAGGNDTFQFQQDMTWQNTVALERGTGSSVSINGFNGSYDTFIGGSGVDTLNGTTGNDYIAANNGATNLIQGLRSSTPVRATTSSTSRRPASHGPTA